MSFEAGFKIPGSFLKKKSDQCHTENAETHSPEVPPLVRRQGISSSRLFGNLTRGGPTSVQSGIRNEGSSFISGCRSSFLKPKDRRYDALVKRDGLGDLSQRRPTSVDVTDGSVSRFKLVRNVDKNVKEQNVTGSVVGEAEERLGTSSVFRKRSSGNLATAAAVKRATKLVRAKQSSTHGERTEVVKHAYTSNLPIVPSTSQTSVEPNFVFPSKFRATSFAAESKTTTRDVAVLLRSLLALVGKHCPADYDRYLVLEERDKLLSKLRDEEDKNSGGRTRVITGQCSGMCPEKERYVRVVQKRISPFECGADGSMQPHLMVKEYARSAADQDNPLPHELRSEALLENTMDYLLRNVLDSIPESDDDLSLWYDFLWSRTRAIRKEITQLMLSDKTAVALFERCARLHILCAYKLCHLDLDKFNQNMNTENLAKCLQSLRHLYEDLRLQGNIFDTEAEFRGYDVMLHLYDSNILRQVLSYRKEVRESKPVRLALQLSSALQNKNYVRFFRLLKKEATFLQCCICHRYFSTVQSKALLTMMIAYGRNPVFNLDTIWRILAWNDRDDALTSLAQYGIHQNDMECDQVILNRDLFVQDASLPLRPYRWIDDKNTDVLSQVAYGPTPFSFTSTACEPNSFDDDCFYNKDPVIHAVFERYSLESEAQQQLLSQRYASAKEIPSCTEHSEMKSWIGGAVQNVLHEVADEQTFSICRVVNVEEVAISVSDYLLEDIIRDLLLDVLSDERDLESEQVLLKFSRLKEEKQMLVQLIVEELVCEVLCSNLKTLIKLELQKAVRDHIDTAAHGIVDELWRSKLVHIVDKETKAVLKKTLKMDFNEVSMGLRRFRERMELLWLRQFWDAWRSHVLESRRKRLERKRNWEGFQGVWNCQMFVPSSYVSNTKDLRNGLKYSLCTLIDENEIRRTLRLAQLKRFRTKRIMRIFFDRWRNYVQRRHELRIVAIKMLHRSGEFSSFSGSTSSIQFQPSYAAKSKRKRILSPSLACLPGCSLDYKSSNSPNIQKTCTQVSLELSTEFRFEQPVPFCSDAPVINNALTSAENSLSTSISAGESNCSNGENLFSEALSLHERMLTFSKDLNSLIMQRKRTDDECRRTAFQLESLYNSISTEM